MLQGLRVLEATQFLAGPLAGIYLAAMGAEVIKIEKPEHGDDARRIGPFEERSGESAYFMSVNRGKKSVALDLKDAEGRRAFVQLAAGSDIVLENMRPGVMEKLGLGYEQLRCEAKNDGLIYAAVSGFRGQEHAARPAFDSLLQAAGGLLAVTGEGPGKPCRVGVSVVDYVAGLNTVAGVLAALHRRDRCPEGSGMRVDTAMLQTSVALCENPVARHSVTGAEPEPLGLAHPVVAPFDAFATRDGTAQLYIAISNDRHFRGLCEALGLADIADDDRFRTNVARVEHRGALRAVLEQTLARRATREWEELLIPAGVPCSAICSIGDVKRRFPDAFLRVQHPTAGELQMSAFPTTFDGVAPGGFADPAPTLGQHTEEVLLEAERWQKMT